MNSNLLKRQPGEPTKSKLKSAMFCPVCHKVWDLPTHAVGCPVCTAMLVRVWDYGKGFEVYQAADLPLSDLESEPDGTSP